MLRIVFVEHAQQHLRVRRNTGQRRVHFVRHAGGQQTNRRELLALLQLLFESNAGGDVFKHNKRARLSLRVLQRSEGDVQNETAIGSCSRVELVDVSDLLETPAIFTENLLECVSKIFGKQILDVPADRGVATKIKNMFER